VLPRAAAAATAEAAAAAAAAPAHSSAPTSTGFQVDHARCRQHPTRRIRSPRLRSPGKKVERYNNEFGERSFSLSFSRSRLSRRDADHDLAT